MCEYAETDVVRIKIISSYYIKNIQDHVWYHKHIGETMNVVNYSDDQWQVLNEELKEKNAFINKKDTVILGYRHSLEEQKKYTEKMIKEKDTVISGYENSIEKLTNHINSINYQV